jgi:hypothetical protein
MANYKKQYLNLYPPGGAAAGLFQVQQKADEALISREDQKIKFYCPDFVVRKKDAVPANEVDVSVFGKFDSLDTDISSGFASRDVTIAAQAATAAALAVTVASNKTADDLADAAEISARTSADTALAATATANKAAQDAGFGSATAARAADKASVLAAVQTEEDARVAAITSVQASIALVLNNASTGAIDSIAELVTAFDGLAAEDTSIAALITSLTSRMTAAEGVLAQLLNVQ